MYRKAKIIVIFKVVVVAMFLTTNISLSQELASVSEGSEVTGYFMFGKATINITDLNTKLESKGYSQLSDNMISVGGGEHVIIKNRLLLGGEGHGLFGEKATSGNYKNSISIGYGFFNAGYVVYSVNNFRLYPLLGLGGGGMKLKITENAASLSFDEVLNNPERENVSFRV